MKTWRGPPSRCDCRSARRSAFCSACAVRRQSAVRARDRMATGGGGQSARSLLDPRLPIPNSELVPLGPRAAVVRVAHQLQIGRRRPMRSMLITAGRVANADGAAGRVKWSVDVPPDRLCDRPSRRATAVDRASLDHTAGGSQSHLLPLPLARRWLAGAQRRLLEDSPAPAHFFGSRQDAPRLL